MDYAALSPHVGSWALRDGHLGDSSLRGGAINWANVGSRLSSALGTAGRWISNQGNRFLNSQTFGQIKQGIKDSGVIRNVANPSRGNARGAHRHRSLETAARLREASPQSARRGRTRLAGRAAGAHSGPASSGGRGRIGSRVRAHGRPTGPEPPSASHDPSHSRNGDGGAASRDVLGSRGARNGPTDDLRNAPPGGEEETKAARSRLLAVPTQQPVGQRGGDLSPPHVLLERK
ncbi:pVI [Fowl aviadenovirus E]|uniref:PVI n=1 Tax=Fowl aviadenovirus E TaxID=190065 RepID=E9KLA5_9ADEN|nr:pVI [Fowl aviadenovirus E]ADE58398.1 pVI [Fowl aviadenovirus E]